MKKQLSFLMVLFATVCHQVIADQITLKNGDRLTGQVIKADKQTLVFKSELLGDVTVALANVDRISTDKPFFITLASGRTVLGVLSASGDTVEISPANAGSVSVKKSEI